MEVIKYLALVLFCLSCQKQREGKCLSNLFGSMPTYHLHYL